ncbi:calpain-9-like isoform X2 [Physella acuta]|uniref:calpain-9-like isoform X2 n=1 Tax=Physella acuta TaxID=109671 RepID=UPI0027DD65C8|nr:calpain-9-like isoform X2 [Physella acuta]
MQYFTDPDFPPDTEPWKRPREIVGNPQFIVDGASRHDIDQGALGRFVFNFYPNGVQQTVYVDDRLPTSQGQLVYCSNKATPNEFWPCLLEKAYAKFKGGYANLNGGHIKQALQDLTGRPVNVRDIRADKFGSAAIFHFLQEGGDNGALIVAGIYLDGPGDGQLPNGLVKGHAYSVTKLHQLTTPAGVVNLIRLRNPWGCGEWNGAWSDSSREMASLSRRQQEELKFHTQDDGEFWMEFKDFVRNFHEINICYV